MALAAADEGHERVVAPAVPILVDSTLREGAQAPRVRFTPRQQLEIVRRLQRVGIDEMEVGYAADTGLAEFLRRVRERSPALRMTVWCRARVEDVEASARLRPAAIAVALPASDLHLERRLGRGRRWALEQVPLLRGAAADVPLSLGFEDASRADEVFVAELCGQAAASRVDRIRLADTVGVASPKEVARLIALARRHFGAAVGLHAHDDFGMATANAISAIEAGATRVDVSVSGLGERAGISKLEEVVAFLALKHGDGRFRVDQLPALAQMVAEAAGRPIDPHRPVVGHALFECESGIHVDGLLKEPSTYEPYEPDWVGASRRRVWLGDKSGRSAVIAAVRLLGASSEGLAVERLVLAVRARARRSGHPIGDDELRELVERHRHDVA